MGAPGQVGTSVQPDNVVMESTEDRMAFGAHILRKRIPHALVGKSRFRWVCLRLKWTPFR